MTAQPTNEAPQVQGRVHMYQRIATELRRRVYDGEFGPGVLLPSETHLAEAYGTSRLTVKRALDMLRKDGLIDARRGFGWFVVGGSVRHGLGELSTIDEAVTLMGLHSERRVLEFAFGEPSDEARAVLDCDLILKTRRLNLADGRAAAHVTTWCPATLASRLSHSDVEAKSFYELLPVEIGGATQVITAVGADPEDADLLDVRVGSPCLRSERTTFSVDGVAVLYAVAVFPGHSTEYQADLQWHNPRSDTGQFVPLPPERVTAQA